MNKFAEWIEKNNQKQAGVAKKIGISTSTMHEILRMGKLPKLQIAYDIEKYTGGDVTLYDWFDYETANHKKVKTKNMVTKNKKQKARNSGS